METSTKVYYFHGKTADGYRFTIAGRYQPLLENDQDQDVDVIMMGASLCGAKDQYVKKLGRVKAEGRMKQKDINGRTYYSLYGGEQDLLIILLVKNLKRL